jgi:class 3 adenylate cyclase/energy-coupling factor transporter ATP-binding protein EcfA2
MPVDVTDWLHELGLEQYATAFRENAIDTTVLRSLTAEDLKDLGVTLVGHRRRLLDAIAALQAEHDASQPPLPSRTGPSSIGAERRQLSVMFCDLVGSTALSTRFDPEDLREVIGAYHRSVTEVVARFDGFVAKYMGDGVLIYFGYPRAHEDDAERSVRAGLAVIQAVTRLDTGSADLRARIGIATGLAVVGDLIGEGSAREESIVGETPNLAARLQTIAGPASLVIGATTRQQIGELFDLEDLGPQQLAGFAQPQRAWRVLGESGEASRFRALRSGTTPLLGRDEEMELLVRRWHRAKTGDGRVVLISGEPGIGKSRLTNTLAAHIAHEKHGRLQYFCSPHHQDSALYPFIVHLEHAAGFVRDDPTDVRIDKLRALLASGISDEDGLALLSELLSLPSSVADLNLSPQRKREKLLNALLGQLDAETQRSPVLIVFEDVHWIDPTSRELLDLMVDRVRRVPALLTITFRPEFLAPWVGRSHVTSVALSRLSENDGAELAQALAGDAVLGANVISEIVERTDGVPLFVEELTKALLERSGREGGVASVLGTTAPSVPATLQASLVARLDRLGPASKEIAQIGAVLGREFTYELVHPVAQQDDSYLQAALRQLTDAELMFCRGVPPHSSYLFKHALVQDAAYGTLLRAKRYELHARVAAVLEQDFADLVARQPELLAHHLTAAGDMERAVDEWLKAGQFAAARSTHIEAIRHFERGLGALASLPEGPARDEREIELQLARGLSFFTTGGFIAPDAAQAYKRASELAERQGNQRQLYMATYGLWQSANGAGQILDCRRLSNRLQELTAESTDDELLLQAHHSAWATSLFGGEPSRAREHAEAGRQLYDPERHRNHHRLYGGHDPGCCARWLAAQAHWLLGQPDKALEFGKEALALARQLGHPFSLALAFQYNSMLHLDRGESQLALQLIDAVEELAAEQRLGFVLEPQILRGSALINLGGFEEATALLHEGLAQPAAMRLRCYGSARLAEALMRQHKHHDALATAMAGLRTAEETGHRQWEAELHRVKGLALCKLNSLKEGQVVLERALEVARKQQAIGNELRAAISLASLWGERSRRGEASQLLGSIYGRFNEGLDTTDLREAKTLLDELA